MAEFVKGRALSEDSAPLPAGCGVFILVLSQAFSAGVVHLDGACFFPHRVKPRAAVPDRKTPEAPHTAFRVLMKQ